MLPREDSGFPQAAKREKIKMRGLIVRGLGPEHALAASEVVSGETPTFTHPSI